MFTLALLTDHDATDIGVTDARVLTTSQGRIILGWDHLPDQLVRVTVGGRGFGFWADEVSKAAPILVRGFDLAVTSTDDLRDLAGVRHAHTAAAPPTALDGFATVEDDYESAAARSRQLRGPTWLGLGRDYRTFAFSLRGVGAGRHEERLWDWVAPQWHGEPVNLDGIGPVRYQLMVGRGLGPQDDITRRLDQGKLPILTSTIRDGAITYHVTTFVCLERTPLTPDANRGTPYLLADGHSAGHMFTAEQQAEFDRLSTSWTPDQQTVIVIRVVANNTGSAPRHAFLTLPAPYVGGAHLPVPGSYNAQTGISLLGARDDDLAYCVTRVDGEPAPSEEIARLVPAGQSVTFDMRLPHTPLDARRMIELGDRDYSEMLTETRSYWQNRLDTSARIELPDRRLTEMVGAGLLHLDLVAYGTEPNGTLAPTIGVYAPIGSESAPIIQFFDSIGQTQLAERSLQYFLDKQHHDGFMQNFGGYMLETEAALWSLGEHFRYTRDLDWVKAIRPHLESAVGYILGNRHAQQESRRDPHGLIMGKTADPEDPFAAYMLNGFAAIGLSRAAEMITDLDSDLAARWQHEASSLRTDIRASLAESMNNAPVVPLADGTWSRTAPPWAGQSGPLAIDRSPQRWYTHGTITARDALLGPLWLVTQEVLDCDELVTTELLQYHCDLLFHDNVAFSQPYYSPHLLTHLRRGEVGAFLRAYYTMAASIADPETYSFWEHYFHASPHKTHEEAWFLMQTRWMLWLEDHNRLRLLPGIPRRWLATGQRVRLEHVRSYFGEIALNVTSNGDTVNVTVTGDPERAPSTILVRLPAADGPRNATSSNGSYDPATETLTLDGYGTAVVNYA